MVGNTLVGSSKSNSAIASAQNAITDISALMATRKGIITDGTMDAAILAGLPPDVRGVIDLELFPCPPGEIESADLAEICDGKTDSYSVMTTKTLRANGSLEPVRHLLFRSAREFDPTVVRWFVYREFKTNLMQELECVTKPGADGKPGSGVTFLKVVSHIDSSGTSAAPLELDLPIRLYCYANGTCDPVTYLGHRNEFEGRRTNTLISVSMTGSIVTLPPNTDVCDD